MLLLHNAVTTAADNAVTTAADSGADLRDCNMRKIAR